MDNVGGRRIYFDTDDVVDALLGKKITDRVLVKSSLYIEDLAMNFGVRPERIAHPVPFKIARLAMCYALMMTALESSRMASNGEQDGADAYELNGVYSPQRLRISKDSCRLIHLLTVNRQYRQSVL